MKEQLIESYRQYLITLGYQRNTVSMLPSCLRSFLAYTSKPLEELKKEDILDFYQYLAERPNKRRPGSLSEQYIHHHMYALKTFFSFQLKQGHLQVNPMTALSFPSPSTKQREVLTLNETLQLYRACENYREKAMLSLYYGCGLRRKEVEDLNVKDILFRTGVLIVRSGKNSKRRAVPMSDGVQEDLKNYLFNERDPRSEQKAFLLNKRGGRMLGNSHYMLLKELLERIQLDKDITLHSLRHSIATHLLKKGLSIEYVRDFLGHSHLESTQVYTRVSKEQLVSL